MGQEHITRNKTKQEPTQTHTDYNTKTQTKHIQLRGRGQITKKGLEERKGGYQSIVDTHKMGRGLGGDGGGICV